MKFAALAVLLSLLAVPAIASAPQKPALLHSTAAQRAAAEVISARIKSALEGRAYTLGRDCRGDDCAVSSGR